jgi:hypothetical protein
MCKKSMLFVCIVLMGMSSPVAMAKLLVYEPFDYAPTDK